MNRAITVALSCLLLLLSAPSAMARPGLMGNGIRFHYRAHKLGATIMKASLSIEHDGPFYVVKVAVDSKGVVRPVFRMHNRFTSYLRETGLEPWRYIKEIDQKGIFSKKKHYTDILTFDSANCKVRVERVAPPTVQEVSVPPQTCDPLSVFLKFFLKSQVVNGQKIVMRIYDGIKLKEVSFGVTKGEIDTPLYGTVKTTSLESKVAFSSLGDKEGIIKIWYTDDERSFPIAMHLKLPSVGNVEFDLEKVETW
jgi:hypothetical protein